MKKTALDFSQWLKKAEQYTQKPYEELVLNVLADKEIENFIIANNMVDTAINRSISAFNRYIRERANSAMRGYKIRLFLYNPYNDPARAYAETTYPKTQAQAEKEAYRTTFNVLMRDSIVSDKSILNARFENFQTFEDMNVVNNLQFAEKIADDYIAGKKFNTLFFGQAGSGKSHLAMAIAKRYNETTKNKKVIFANLGEVTRRIKMSWDYDLKPELRAKALKESEAHELLAGADLLVLDDIGAESTYGKESQASKFAQGFLYSVLDSRENTILTTNLKKISDVYDRRNESRILKGSTGRYLSFNDLKDRRR